MKITETIGSLLKFKNHSRILSISPEQSVFEALELMAEYDVGALLVISGHHLIGILSDAITPGREFCLANRPGTRGLAIS